VDDLFKVILGEPLKPWLEPYGLADHSIEAAGALWALLVVLVGWLTSLAKKLWQAWTAHRLAADLHPNFTYDEVNRATRYFIPTQYQSLSPAQEEEPGRPRVVPARNPLIPWMLQHALVERESAQRFYLVLAGSGMGKTTFMINLYLRYRRQVRFRKYQMLRCTPNGADPAFSLQPS
jgi:hypothetical protein